MLLVDPKAVIAADHPVDVEHGGVHQSANGENAAELALGKAVLEAVHGKSTDRRSEVSGQNDTTWYSERCCGPR